MIWLFMLFDGCFISCKYSILRQIEQSDNSLTVKQKHVGPKCEIFYDGWGKIRSESARALSWSAELKWGVLACWKLLTKARLCSTCKVHKITSIILPRFQNSESTLIWSCFRWSSTSPAQKQIWNSDHQLQYEKTPCSSKNQFDPSFVSVSATNNPLCST